MPTFTLQPHPLTRCGFIETVSVVVEQRSDGGLRCVYGVEGEIDRLVIPEPRDCARTDGLWLSTCFEIFLRTAGSADYDEFNFAPSGEWAAYRFEHYRSGMVELELGCVPRIVVKRQPHTMQLDALIGISERPAADLLLALSAVLKDREGNVSYWALKHPQGKPDFHHADSFVIGMKGPVNGA